MKKRMRFRYRNVYIFIFLLFFMGLITGSKYYNYQDDTVKKNIESSLNLKENLKSNANNIGKRSKIVGKTFFFSILILGVFYNIYHIFFEAMALGFLFKVIKHYSFKFKFFYLNVYHIIPLFFILVLIRVGFYISKYLLLYLVNRKNRQYLLALKMMVKKYLLITSFLLIYEFIVFLNSSMINKFLLSLI